MGTIGKSKSSSVTATDTIKSVEMSSTTTETQQPAEYSHVESQGPFHRVVLKRDGLLCLPNALFENTASEARDHCCIICNQACN